jgi:CheY-like chemotaxis protein
MQPGVAQVGGEVFLEAARLRAGGDPARTQRVDHLGDLVVTDVVMPDENAFDVLPRIKKLRPDLPIIVMSAQNTFMTAIKASERGAYEYLPKPFDLKELIAVVGRALSRPKDMPVGVADDQADDIPLVGRSPAMQDIYRSLARLMQTDLTVMISGESGTGKELVARALHDYGKRRRGPFVAVNMAAIPRDLIESELFGHEKGAFTGAMQRASGRFEQAEGGTLFLDEIGDMPMEAQTRLLRVLQQGEYTVDHTRRFEVTELCLMLVGPWARTAYLAILSAYMYGGLCAYASVWASSFSANVPTFLHGGTTCNVADGDCTGPYLLWLSLFAAVAVRGGGERGGRRRREGQAGPCESASLHARDAHAHPPTPPLPDPPVLPGPL